MRNCKRREVDGRLKKMKEMYAEESENVIWRSDVKFERKIRE
jgi:hypothetical protein